MNNKNYNINELLDRLAQQIRDWMQERHIDDPLIVGIHTSGVWIADELQKRLQLADEPGELNMTFYRDDFSRVGLHPQSKPSLLPDVDDRHILLVDDVLYTGRTIRGAMNELFDFGRPASITAAVLVARGGRELPIEAQLTALREEPGFEYSYEVSGPEPLSLTLIAKQ
ncbi:MAG TPA: bifunctional pyr operon transcriptional regulator/uracil phosphoribosyltransferase PyrR [Candidatus Thiothrix moscowensis]|uniref:bifunctional pyr operon transcriptional regulator/uracil phosphoribosyltransferase PyrR n=1 Tax=unclassified Thiothrix TaxID=2636184 RepID=UPI0025E518A9|nr:MULTISPECIES: bifunctional pyr operon transcriptional regulator/uracil phosphoribosyltransferase PyrR [unclassified Thiothrix]HRJ52596.1 bifunctional pyr operon transcriptional regulator/uracil phosphoribosyltransferase PyrR [Candidatus Thiothrix moscowensis]HRJ92920.1 bifunctional pyr operon transcriptional regulator/uracil phosphoribosyltransferase PyrR [Candidatus Thiothrix moscowensis]